MSVKKSKHSQQRGKIESERENESGEMMSLRIKCEKKKIKAV